MTGSPEIVSVATTPSPSSQALGAEDSRLVGATIYPGPPARYPTPPATMTRSRSSAGASPVLDAMNASAAPQPAALPAVPVHPVFKYPVMFHHERRASILSHFFRGLDVETDVPAQEELPTYRGLLNLCIILLVLSNLRLMVENIRKYGVLVDFRSHFTDVNPREWPSVLTVVSLALPILCAYALEHVARRQLQATLHRTAPKASEVAGVTPAAASIVFTPIPLVGVAQALNVAVVLLWPITAIRLFRPSPLASLIVMLLSCVLACKLWSYSDVNARLRELYEIKVRDSLSKSGKMFVPTTPTEYPNNLRLADLSYFVAIPTLCYETCFPRTERIRWSFVAKRTFELLLISFIEYFIAVQYMLPLLNNTLSPFSKMEIIFLSERIMKLAVPNLIVWLLGFYAFFHLWLNILAELLRYGDRLFYKDWWNCTTVGTFWKTWNLGVHYWFVQHVYRPMRARGYSRNATLLAIFFISAVFHELIVSVAFSTVSYFAFAGMIAQVLAILASEPMKGKQIGNVFFWVTIMLGQPLIVLFYFVDFVSRRSAAAAAGV